MIEFAGDAILLDIEGTTSSVTFVYDVMFPYAHKHLERYLRAHWGEALLRERCAQIALDAGCASLKALLDPSLSEAEQQARVAAEVRRQMDADLKATGLKSLQGDIWKAGFESGELVSHVYDDVVPCLKAWKAQGLSIRVYSSGSIAAQRLFFGHSQAGDLLHFFDGHYDTTIGSKREPPSYAAIVRDWGRAAARVLFVSDVSAELDAAQEAGMATALCCRAERMESAHPVCVSLNEINVVKL